MKTQYAGGISISYSLIRAQVEYIMQYAWVDDGMGMEMKVSSRSIPVSVLLWMHVSLSLCTSIPL